MSIKSQFSIKDLENLSGVKAHTIRIWEKRYNLLSPQRTDTNIRRYTTESLKKILDVAYLYNDGHKISKIALLDEDALKEMIVASVTKETTGDVAINDFKKAMLTFDTEKFNLTFNTLSLKLSFDQIFTTIFIPFLIQIGTLWHSEAIDVAHERFISELIKRKTVFHIEQEFQKRKAPSTKQTFCLFLPKQEIHDIGLLFANYLLNKNNFNTIFLGHNIPLESLAKLTNSDKIIYITYLTVAPDINETIAYLNDFNATFDFSNHPPLWLLGSKSKNFTEALLPDNVKRFDNLDNFLNTLKSLN